MRAGLRDVIEVDTASCYRVAVVSDDLLSEHEVVRHDSHRLARVLLNIHHLENAATLDFANARRDLPEARSTQSAIEEM
jgi:hypothetical protein